MEDINIIFVDDEDLILSSLKRLLRKEPYTIYYAQSGEEALEIMEKNRIQILVTDMKMPGMDGLALLREAKDKYPDMVRIALSAHTMTAQLLPCINTGEIYRFITKPISPEELRNALMDASDYFMMRTDRIELINELKGKNEQLRVALERQQYVENQLRQLTITDPLTGLFNRRYLDVSIEHSFEKCKRYNEELSCLMIDLDHFKAINDNFGHDFGDFVLKEFALRLKSVIRSADIAFRYGGEEFTVLLPRTDLDQALLVAKRILSVCSNTPFNESNNDTLLTADIKSAFVTTSIGAASFRYHQSLSPKDLIIVSDKMLYLAKQNGRNQVAF